MSNDDKALFSLDRSFVASGRVSKNLLEVLFYFSESLKIFWSIIRNVLGLSQSLKPLNRSLSKSLGVSQNIFWSSTISWSLSVFFGFLQSLCVPLESFIDSKCCDLNSLRIQYIILIMKMFFRFVHHLTEDMKLLLKDTNIKLPLLSHYRHDCGSSSDSIAKEKVCDAYQQQVTCADCHSDF